MSALARELSFSSSGRGGHFAREMSVTFARDEDASVLQRRKTETQRRCGAENALIRSFSRGTSGLTIPVYQSNAISRNESERFFEYGYLTPHDSSANLASTPQCPSPPRPDPLRSKRARDVLSRQHSRVLAAPDVIFAEENAAVDRKNRAESNDLQITRSASRPAALKKPHLAANSDAADAAMLPMNRFLGAMELFHESCGHTSATAGAQQKKASETRASSLFGILASSARAAVQSRYVGEFQSMGVLGSGNNAVVMKAKNRVDGCTYAIKRSRKPFRSNSERNQALSEVHALSALPPHPNVVRYYCSWLEDESTMLYVQLEYCKGNIALGNSTCPEGDEQLAQMMLQTARALEHIHEHGMAHMDVKPDNMLVAVENKQNSRAQLKLADFGLCCKSDGSDYTGNEGDCRYLAPEILDSDTLARTSPQRNDPMADDVFTAEDEAQSTDTSSLDFRQADIFALGASFVELITRDPLPAHGHGWHQLRQVPSDPSTIRSQLVSKSSPCLADIVLACLAEPNRRPTAANLVVALTALLQ